MSIALSAVLAEATVTHVELPFPAFMFGVIALVIFLVLGFVAWTYRDVANRHPQKSAAFAATHDDHGNPLSSAGAGH